jgi:hypothetical protein
MFKKYKNKIHVYVKNGEDWVYIHSTHAYKLCRLAVYAMEEKHPKDKFKACFAKD